MPSIAPSVARSRAALSRGPWSRGLLSRVGADLLDDVVLLVRDTLTVFVRLFPQITAITLLGWVLDQASLRLAAIVGSKNGWAAVMVFSTSFLFDLVAVVLVLRVCGQELGIRALIPQSETVDDDGRDTSLSRLVAVTLLPFLGIYSAFGLVSAKAGRLTIIQQFEGGFLNPPSVLGAVRGLATDHPRGMLALLVGLYLVRRVTDLLHERTGIWLLGILTALIESFFILVVIFGGFLLLHRPVRWLSDRQLFAWLDAAGRAVERVFASLHLPVPELARTFAGFLADPVWPLFVDVVSQPIIWLAVAALVYGSQVLSLADLWRKGQPTAARVIGTSTFDRRSDRRALLPDPPRGLLRAGGELKEAFLGDIDDKYLPTFHSLRLILRAGFTFLGAYVAVYTLVIVGRNYVQVLYLHLIGGRDIDVWMRAGPFLDVLDIVPWEPLRLCLLAVAFRRCLELFRLRSSDSVDPSRAPAAPDAAAPAVHRDDLVAEAAQ